VEQLSSETDDAKLPRLATKRKASKEFIGLERRLSRDASNETTSDNQRHARRTCTCPSCYAGLDMATQTEALTPSPSCNNISSDSSFSIVSDSSRARCYNCHESGHVRRDCPIPTMKMCYNCHDVGHISFQCKQAKHCRQCFDPTHLERDCPKRQNVS